MNYNEFMEKILNCSYKDWGHVEENNFYLRSDLDVQISIPYKGRDFIEPWVKEITTHEIGEMREIFLVYKNTKIYRTEMVSIDGYRCLFPLPSPNHTFDETDIILYNILNCNDVAFTYMNRYNFRCRKKRVE
jgi:hypothetical protein